METNNLQNNNEIDLLDVLKKIGKSFVLLCQNLSKILGIIILFFIKKSLWLAFFLILGIIVSVYAYKNSIRTYSSMMMARANVLDNTFMIDQVRELGQIRDTLVLAKVLDIPDSAAKHIVNLDAFYGIATADGALSYIDTERKFKYDPKDSIYYRIPGTFYIQLRTNNEYIFDFIGNKLIKALSSNPYIIAHNDLRLEQQRTRLVEVNHQLHLLDSLQQTDYFKKQQEPKVSLGQFLLSTEKDRQLYHDHIFNIHNTKQSIEATLAGHNAVPIAIMRDFTSLSAAVDNPLNTYLRRWIPVFFLLGMCFVVVLHFRKKIWQLIKEG